MALTVTIEKDGFGVEGAQQTVRGRIAFDSSYPANGESLTPAMIGLKTIDYLEVLPKSGFTFEYDYTNQKIKVQCPAVVVGAAGAATLDDFPLTGVGATTAVSIGLDAAAGSATNRFGAQQELADTTNLSTLTGVRFFARGV